MTFAFQIWSYEVKINIIDHKYQVEYINHNITGAIFLKDRVLTEEERSDRILVNKYITSQGIHLHVHDELYGHGIIFITLESPDQISCLLNYDVKKKLIMIR